MKFAFAQQQVYMQDHVIVVSSWIRVSTDKSPVRFLALLSLHSCSEMLGAV